MKRLGGFASGGLVLGFALAVAGFSAAPAVAGPFGATASIRDMSTTPIVDVQARRVRPVGRPGRPVARGRGRGNGAGVAAGLIGAAIIGGAIIANSQPRASRRQYYVDDGYYDGGDPYYGSTGYVVQQPQPYYGGGGYYQQPGYYRQPRVRGREYGYDPQSGGYVSRQRGVVATPGPASGK